MIRIAKATILSSVLLIILSACNSGSGSNTSNSTNPVPTPLPTPTSPNLMISVSQNNGSSNICGNLNIPCVTVTICSPTDSKSCQTVDNILIDSGSVGLRVFNTALGSLASDLPYETSNDEDIGDCVGYGDYSANWGPVVTAAISLGGQTTTQNVPMQIINASFVDKGTACLTSLGGGYKLATSPSQSGYNGILGVAPLVHDTVTNYFTCTSSQCTESMSLESSLLVSNPIAYLSESYESGITFQFPAIGANGASNVTGYAIFGVGSNNENTFESGVNIYPISINGNCRLFICMQTLLSGTSTHYGFLDTGSNFLYFDDIQIPKDSSSFYTPSSTITLSPNNLSISGVIATNLNIANADNLLSNNNSAFDNIGANLSSYLDYGLPFFYGKTVYICFDGMTCNGTPGPYWAF